MVLHNANFKGEMSVQGGHRPQAQYALLVGRLGTPGPQALPDVFDAHGVPWKGRQSGGGEPALSAAGDQ